MDYIPIAVSDLPRPVHTIGRVTSTDMTTIGGVTSADLVTIGGVTAVNVCLGISPVALTVV